jgi:hypothetical protein
MRNNLVTILLLAVCLLSTSFAMASDGKPSKKPKSQNCLTILGDYHWIGSTTENGQCKDITECKSSTATCMTICPCPPCPTGGVLAGNNYANVETALLVNEIDGWTVTLGDGTVKPKYEALQFKYLEESESLSINFWCKNPLK